MGISLASLINRSSFQKSQNTGFQYTRKKTINGAINGENKRRIAPDPDSSPRGLLHAKIYHRRHGSGIHELMSLFILKKKRKKSTSLPHGEKRDGE